MLQKIKRCMLFALTIAMLVPAVSGFAATPKQEALSAYNRWLSGAKVQVMPKGYLDYDEYNGKAYTPTPASQTLFGIAYINNDSIPELVVKTADGRYESVLTYRNGKIVRIDSTHRMLGTMKGYYSRTGMFLDERYWPDSISRSSYKVMGTAGVSERFEVYTFKRGLKDYIYRTRDNKTVNLRNQTEFRKKILTFTKGKPLTLVKFYKDTAANRKNILK